MGNLAQLDLRARGGEARVRALLEDIIFYHKGVYPGHALALAVWFGKSAENGQTYRLFELFTGPPMGMIVVSQGQSLLWKTGSNEPPFVDVYATSVDFMTDRLRIRDASLAQYRESSEVLYFDKRVLTPEILGFFNVVTEPAGLLKGWYVSEGSYSPAWTLFQLFGGAVRGNPGTGLVKTEEAVSFETCRGILHVQVEQRWLPVTSGGLQDYGYYRDFQDGHPGYFVFEGGALYQIIKFEVKTMPGYAERVIEKPRDDRYVEVYLRAVPAPARSPA